jgi:ribosomal protein L11 methyltransferase
MSEVNGLEGRVACVEAAGFDHPAFDAVTPADLVFANILKGPLIDLAPEMARRVAPGGHAILSGLLTEQGAGCGRDLCAARVQSGPQGRHW